MSANGLKADIGGPISEVIDATNSKKGPSRGGRTLVHL